MTTVFVSKCFKTSVVQYRQINAGTLLLQFSRSGTKLERTALTTGGFTVPAFDIVYIVQLGFERKPFRNCLSYGWESREEGISIKSRGKLHKIFAKSGAREHFVQSAITVLKVYLYPNPKYIHKRGAQHLKCRRKTSESEKP